MTDSVKSAARGGYTSHGHPIPDAALYPPDRPRVARCGGVGLCAVCSQQSARWHSEQAQQDESEAQRAVRVRELEAERDMARQEYHELEEFHRLYIYPCTQRAKQAEARLEKIRALAGDPGLWSAYDWRRTKLLELLDGEDDE